MVHYFPSSAMLFLNREDALQFVRERQDLFDAAGQQNPFASSAWILHFIEHTAGENWKLTVPDCLDDGESVMLLYQQGKSLHRLSALANCYTSLYSPLVSFARDRGAALGRLVHELAGMQPACAAIQFAPLDRDSPDTVALGRVFEAQGWYVKRYFCFGNWYLPCTGLSFEAYMAGRDGQLYNTWARKSRKFRSGDAARLEIITDPADVEAALDAYEQVYRRSWKEIEGDPEFIRGWGRVCARNGWLRLGLAWVDEMPVASQFWFTLHGRANIFKLAYDEAYSKWSAGTLLTAHMIKYSLEQDHVAEIDYLTGDDSYKRFWMSARRERIGLLVCNPRTPRGAMLSAYELAGAMRQRWHRFLRRSSGQGLVARP